MTYTKKQFLEDVAAEATALKEHATPEEIARLDFESLDPNNACRCIYGQATGNCFSERAVELIEKCAPTFLHCCAKINDDIMTVSKYGLEHYSPIEKYVQMNDAKNANLIAFLKGDRKDLVL